MSRKIKVDEFNSFEEFDSSNTAGEYERVTVIRENGWFKCDLLTECKTGKTAVKRLFDSLESNGITDVSEWREFLNESLENGYYKDNDRTLADGTKNPNPCYYWEIDCTNEDSIYITINVRIEEPAAPQEQTTEPTQKEGKSKRMNKTYLYCRISTGKQSIERQIRNLTKEYPTGKVISEEYTGTTTDRKEWGKLFKTVSAGDTIAFDSVSRMSRNAEEGIAAYKELFNRGVNLVFLKEPHINTATYKKALENNVQLTGSNVDFILEGVNRYLMALAEEQIKIAFDQAEKEVQDLHQRTKEGIETARLNGKQIGGVKGAKLTTKKSIAAKEVILKHSKDFNGSLSDPEMMKLTGLARNTYYRYKAQLKAE